MTASERPKLGAMLLAAGGSSRLGQPKQLIKFEGETLLHRAARSLAESVYFPVVVVVGAEADNLRGEFAEFPVYDVFNDAWVEGMGSSIGVGLRKLLEVEPDLSGVLISLCDQPKIIVEMLNLFAAKFLETPSRVIASAYNGVQGVPALFSREMFGELAELKGDRGARHIIENSQNRQTIDLPEAAVDVDTQADLSRLTPMSW